ncbi:MAG: DUF366 family protein [Candidatus Latescibacteria bacterium]|nr:DUF366 family protein [bacterium]MBD3423177.1 DUF366 family protein [Candidatus Latescibacterota bacterium]
MSNRYEVLGTRWLENEMEYTGVQLRGHFVREMGGIATDGVVAFAGMCRVSTSELVDLEDAEEGSVIRAEKMLHFIGEHFDCPLREANFRLRLFTSIMMEILREGGVVPGLARSGDDLYVGDRKMSVGVATMTPVSAVFHFGVNIDPAGAPVPAAGLNEFDIDPESIASKVLQWYRLECEAIEIAVRKVRGRL